MDYNDIHLLNQIKAGDLFAYESVFKQHYKALVAFAFCFLKDKMDAEDIVQQFFVEMYESKKLGNIKMSLKSYLFTSIRNRCLNSIEKEKSKKRLKEQYIHSLKQPSEEIHVLKQLSGEIRADLNMNTVQLAIQQLPKQRLRALHLVYLEGKEYQKAAEVMGISINSVKTHLKLALKTLRKHMSCM